MDRKLLIWRTNTEFGYFLVFVHQKIARIFTNDYVNQF